mmetsp:Transcript_80180/g.208363  ORF Transcript_80180/g.208363 Transcript_80180/m.208363 type:complete len:268 (-) Transcript_80180:425-1228(-)
MHVDSPNADLEGLVVLRVRGTRQEKGQEPLIVQAQLTLDAILVVVAHAQGNQDKDAEDGLFPLGVDDFGELVLNLPKYEEDELRQLHVIGRLDQHDAPQRKQCRPEPRPPLPALPRSEEPLAIVAGQAIAPVVKVSQNCSCCQRRKKGQLPISPGLCHDATPKGAWHRNVDLVRQDAQGPERVYVRKQFVVLVHVAVCAQLQQVEGEAPGPGFHPLLDPHMLLVFSVLFKPIIKHIHRVAGGVGRCGVRLVRVQRPVHFARELVDVA